MHHGYIGAAIVILCGEGLVLRVLGVELRGPVCLEIDGIEQIGHHQGVYIIQDGGYHAVGLFFAPAVDVVECVGCREVEGFGFGIVVGLHVLFELGLQGEVLVEEDGVCYVERHLVIHFWQAVDQLLTVVVHGLNASLVEAERLF